MKLTVSTATAGFAITLALALSGCNKQEDAFVPDAVAPSEPENPPALAYVSQLAGPVMIYALVDYSKVGEIAVGKGASAIGLTEDGKLLVVAVKESKELAVVDTSTQKVVRRVTVGLNPEFVRVLGNLAFVADIGAEQLPQVTLIDLLTGEKIREINTAYEVEGIEFSADGEHIVLTHANDEKVTIHNIETGEKLEQIDTESFGLRPHAAIRSPNGDQFLIALEYANKLLILDKNYNVISELDTGEVPYGVTYKQDGSEVVVSLVRGKAIQVFDTETLKLKREIPVGERCLHFSFSPDEQQLIVACGGDNHVLVLDYATGNVIKNIPAANTPWGVIVTPESAGTYHTPH